jgi:putative ABC transport system permease protein
MTALLPWSRLAVKEWRRRPLRTAIATGGVSIAVAALFSLLSFHDGYRDGVKAEINRLGAHVLVVPKGCPYDAASIALHGANWPCYLSTNHLREVAAGPNIANAAPALMAAFATSNRSQSVYVGINDRMFALKSEWKLMGRPPRERDEIVAGAEAARLRGWRVGDRVPLPELSGQSGTVTGILQPTHGSDDTFLYPRLEDAQRWFQKPGQLTHILVKVKDADQLDSTVTSLRGCDAGMDMNVVPLSHLFRTMQAVVASTRLLLGGIALIALLVAVTGVSNAVLMSVSERRREIGIMRAVGASRLDVFKLICVETLQVCVAGSVAGVVLALLAANVVESWVRSRLPFSPTADLIGWDWSLAAICVSGAIVLGGIAALLPAWRATELSPAEAIRTGAVT